MRLSTEQTDAVAVSSTQNTLNININGSHSNKHQMSYIGVAKTLMWTSLGMRSGTGWPVQPQVTHSPVHREATCGWQRTCTSLDVTRGDRVRDAPHRKFQMCPCDGHTLPCSQQELSQKRKLEIPSCHPGSLGDYDVLSSPSVKRHRMECACAALQSNFLRMAETAYRSIRRKDTSAASFEQFKRELTQTNYLLKESASLIACIKQMCEHWAHLHVRQQVCPPSHVIESCCQVRHLAN
ncbi:hypothetical protein C0Q70_03227 [Pomacea canaliculata]|uniref:Uncharacterized protein n=1 Tax=Pomacea canaliculata TaxID=400727 RepID=A0A2T7PS51_POMCA|nr:hypothetical protein C0Q70_03227 [Pomacea canaliculata]